MKTLLKRLTGVAVLGVAAFSAVVLVAALGQELLIVSTIAMVATVASAHISWNLLAE